MQIAKRSFFVLIACLGFLIVPVLFSCNAATDQQKPDADTATKVSMVDRGKYLVTIMGCNDCHSPKIMGPQGPEPDPARALSGHPGNDSIVKVDKKLIGNWVLFNASNTAIVGPWGVSYSANLTSDATGIGNWSFEQFETAMRKGKSKGIEKNRMLLPPMPWPNYINAKTDDLRAIYEYLKSTNPVKNTPPQPKAPNQI